MRLLGVEVLVMIVGVAGVLLWLWALVDVLRRPRAEWERIGQSQILWAVVVVVLNVFGALAYAVTARSRSLPA